MHPKDRLGRDGEDAAADHLRRLGLAIVERNWRCRHGEIDIVARDGRTTVFVEVKTRSTVTYGHPFEAITREKMRRLRRLAGLWMVEHDVRGPLRIDAVAVHARRGEPMRLEHLQGVS